MKPRFRIGQTFRHMFMRGKPKYTIFEIYKTFNSKGELIKIEYAARDLKTLNVKWNFTDAEIAFDLLDEPNPYR